MSRTWDVAVLGATGAVGETIISILEERDFPVGTLYPLASSRSAGKTVMFRGKSHAIEDVANFDFSRVQIALFSAGGSVSAQFAPRAAEAGWGNVTLISSADEVPAGSVDVMALAPRLSTPALILWARRGNFPREHYEKLAGRMQDATVQEADTGHFVPMEDPELVVERVLAFSARSGSRDASSRPSPRPSKPRG